MKYLIMLWLAVCLSSCAAEPTHGFSDVIGKWKQVDRDGEIMHILTIYQDSTFDLTTASINLTRHYRLIHMDTEIIALKGFREAKVSGDAYGSREMIQLLKMDFGEDYPINYTLSENLLRLDANGQRFNFLKCENDVCRK